MSHFWAQGFLVHLLRGLASPSSSTACPAWHGTHCKTTTCSTSSPLFDGQGRVVASLLWPVLGHDRNFRTIRQLNIARSKMCATCCASSQISGKASTHAVGVVVFQEFNCTRWGSNSTSHRRMVCGVIVVCYPEKQGGAVSYLRQWWPGERLPQQHPGHPPPPPGVVPSQHWRPVPGVPPPLGHASLAWVELAAPTNPQPEVFMSIQGG